MAEGLAGFTHLFNAMRAARAAAMPGPIAAALEVAGAWFGMIVDGVHVDPAMLRLALRGLARPMLVTDAMPPVGGKRTSFTLYGEEITVQDGRCTRRDGTLAGSVLDMASARTQLRSAARRPARDRAAFCLDQSGGASSASDIGSVGSRRAIAPTWWRSTRPALR